MKKSRTTRRARKRKPAPALGLPDLQQVAPTSDVVDEIPVNTGSMDHQDIDKTKGFDKTKDFDKTKSFRLMNFLRQVRAEGMRVTWPTRNEAIVTTVMVFIMVTLAVLFFLLADQILSFLVAWVLGVGTR